MFLGYAAPSLSGGAHATDNGSARPPPSRPSCGKKRRSRLGALLWYVLFGALHEASHLLAAHRVGLSDGVFDYDRGAILGAVLRAVAGRYCVVPALMTDVDNPELPGGEDEEWRAGVVRHAGWAFSVAAAAFVAALQIVRRQKQDDGEAAGGEKRGGKGTPAAAEGLITCIMSSPCACAAFVTALEALCTDLLGLGRAGSAASAAGVFYCGNFGLVLLDSDWMTVDSGRYALDVLEKMVNVTMMRGAQSGGVVTFVEPKKKKASASDGALVGVRSRCVNAKRTDLSKKVRSKVHRDVFSPLACQSLGHSADLVHTFVGHTRFATSSKATFEGTHPQQWTPPEYRRVYDFSSTTTRIARVENYVTHNGDFDFYELHGRDVELGTVQSWLVKATGAAMPAPVDSAAIAGMVDILRTQGCFGLSVRYAVCLGLPSSKIEEDPALPSYQDCESVGTAFEEALDAMLVEENKTAGLAAIGDEKQKREELAARAAAILSDNERFTMMMEPLAPYVRVIDKKSLMTGESESGSDDEESGGGDGKPDLETFAAVVVDAFFDNDLFHTTRTFLAHAKGSFGLCVTTSLDARRQICLAARGQTMSIVFHPSTGIVLYGSEQAAVKAAMTVELPGHSLRMLDTTHLDVDNDALRLDLDDLGGEICLLDWGDRRRRPFATSPHPDPAVSLPNRAAAQRHNVMQGAMQVYLFQESSTVLHPSGLLYHRMTRLTRNEFIKPLQPEADDLVLQDILDIPSVCRTIQDSWRGHNNGSTNLNRLTAWNLARCLRKRMEGLAEGTIHRDGGTIDILLTGCEVSLWLAEQFASDLAKALPKLRIQAISSNKLLGLFGQEMSIPTTGYPMSEKTHKLNDAIVVVVSHSGGTFSPLACSNLLQSTTKNIFVVTSEWDTQVGKQLRQMNNDEDDQMKLLFNSHIFTTDVGMRPAEPCSVSVAATHQLLTNLFQHICVVVLSSQRFRHVSGAVITERDLRVLERCNQDNIAALEDIVGVDSQGYVLPEERAETERELRKQGDIWSEHILENAKAYIMSFVYIVGTVISGYPLAYLIAHFSGLASTEVLYIVRAIDSLIYFYLPQINVMLLRLVQRRALKHRMVGRTVVIGDIPWVAQAAEAFLSKIFACSYSIAGLNVLSGNPSDHFVHRHTHRVVRGSLVVCGRPDGRLSALSSLESAVCLSVNQASSIQSMGGTCESITIGHNPFALPLTARGIFLNRHRPLFLCERMLGDTDTKENDERTEHSTALDRDNVPKRSGRSGVKSPISKHVSFGLSSSHDQFADKRPDHGDGSRASVRDKRRSSTALMGAYMNLEKAVRPKRQHSDRALNKSRRVLQQVVQQAIHERKWIDQARKLFEEIDEDGDGTISQEEFVSGYSTLKSSLTPTELIQIFQEADVDDSGSLSLDEFFSIVRLPKMAIAVMLQPSIRDSRGLIQVHASDEEYFGENETKASQLGKCISLGATRSQHFSQELYESRIASLQRFVAMTTIFHQMGYRVQSFFPNISFGIWGYRMDRTHSIMRIATTASPVSGADVRERMCALKQLKKVQHSIHVISLAWSRHTKRREEDRMRLLEEGARDARSHKTPTTARSA